MSNRLKIAWLTPLARESAIGLFSVVTAAELSSAADVDLWHPPARHLHSTKSRCIPVPDAAGPHAAALANYDLVVYNLGNHAGFHGNIYRASRAVPGIVILHDFVMHHFFAGHYLPGNPQAYLRAMTAAYGEAGRAAAQRVLAGMRPYPWESLQVEEFPLFEEAIRGAWAVIAHSRFLARRVEAKFQGVVAHLPLAYERKAGAPKSRGALMVPRGHLLIVTTGVITPHRRIAEVLETLSRNPGLCRNLVWAIIGPCDEPYRMELAASIRRYGLENTVRFSGAYVPDADLCSWLNHADLCINLRCPATEGASASLAEQMLFGKPVIVSDTGCYRELPDDCVHKIRIEREAEDLERALQTLIGSEAARKQLGENARRFAAQTFTARRYVAGFLDLAYRLLDAKPLLALADRVGACLAEMGADAQSPLLDTASDEMYRLFCTGRDEPAT